MSIEGRHDARALAVWQHGELVVRHRMPANPVPPAPRPFDTELEQAFLHSSSRVSGAWRQPIGDVADETHRSSGPRRPFRFAGIGLAMDAARRRPEADQAGIGSAPGRIWKPPRAALDPAPAAFTGERPALPGPTSRSSSAPPVVIASALQHPQSRSVRYRRREAHATGSRSAATSPRRVGRAGVGNIVQRRIGAAPAAPRGRDDDRQQAGVD